MFILFRLIGLGLIVVFTSLGINNQSTETRRRIIKIFLGGTLFYITFFLWEIYGPSWVSKCIAHSIGFNEALFIRGTVILTFLAVPMIMAIDRFSFSKTSVYILILIGLTLILFKAQPSAARLSVIGGFFFFGCLIITGKP